MRKVFQFVDTLQSELSAVLLAGLRIPARAIRNTESLQPLFRTSARIQSVLTRAYQLLPLSARGILIATLSAFCLFYYAIPNSDLSATIISSFFLCVCIIAILRGAFAARALRKKLSVELLIDHNEVESRKDIPSGLVLHGLRIPALYRVSFARLFEHPGAESPRHSIRGTPAYGNSLRVIDSCRFAHRGNWQLDGVQVCLQDFLGFTAFTWMLPHKELIAVESPRAEVRPLPIVAASSQPGDLLQHTDNRTGDLFDIKAYDPSDGTKRILWKTYAKSRQLVVRRPEPAMVPEGEVAIFSLARKDDDHVASAASAYIEQLERNNIVVLFGSDILPATDSLDFATPVVAGEFAEQALRLDVWNPTLGSGEGFSRFIEELQNLNKFPQQVILYIDKDRLSENPQSGILARISQLSEQYRVQPVFVVVDRVFLDPRARLAAEKAGSKKGVLTPLRSLQGKGKKSGARQSANYGSLSTTILEAERAEV